MKRGFLLLALICFSLVLFFSFASMAQDQSKTSGPLNYEENETHDEYLKPTYERLSKLYWALAMYELSDNGAIDGYLAINECPLYMKYYDRDFELDDLRQATRESILKNLAFFPSKFEILMPIGLDRYDLGKERFSLDPRSFFLSVKRLDVSQILASSIICNSTYPPKKYPQHFIVAFNTPFTLTDIPVDPEIAEMYLDLAEKEASKGPKSKFWTYYDMSKFKRIAFLRLKVTLTQFKENARNYGYETVPVIFGTIDDYEIYADVDKTLLLYTVSSSDESNRSLSKGRGKRMAIPEGPLIPGTPDHKDEAGTPSPQSP
jgi:hypothetical protein